MAEEVTRVATEAAGEGINLQFCRLMINYDLPWNDILAAGRRARARAPLRPWHSESQVAQGKADRRARQIESITQARVSPTLESE